MIQVIMNSAEVLRRRTHSAVQHSDLVSLSLEAI